VAGILLLVILLPSAMVLSVSSKALSVDQARVVASNLASGVLEQDRAAADSAPWCTFPAPPATPVCEASPQPSLTTLSPQKVNGVTFTFTRAVGWCAESMSSQGVTTWSDYAALPGEPQAYAEYITVSWHGTHSLSAGQVFTSPQVIEEAYDNRPSSSTAQPCPLTGT